MESSYFSIVLTFLAIFVVAEAASIPPTRQSVPRRILSQEDRHAYNVELANKLLETAKQNLIVKIKQPHKNAILARDLYIWLDNVLHEVTIAINRNWFLAEKEFNQKKLGDEIASKKVFDKLEQDMNNLQFTTKKIADSVIKLKEHYKLLVQDSIDAVDYLTADEFEATIQASKREVLSMFKSQEGDHQLKSLLFDKLSQIIENQRDQLEKLNRSKRNAFSTRADAHSRFEFQETKQGFEKLVRASMSDTQLNDKDFDELFIKLKKNALEQFDAKPMGSDEISIKVHQDFHRTLERDMEKFRVSVRS